MPDTLKPFWETDRRETLAGVEHIFPDFPQPALFLEYYLSQLVAVHERVSPNVRNALRNGHQFYPAFVETTRSNLLQFAACSERH